MPADRTTARRVILGTIVLGLGTLVTLTAGAAAPAVAGAGAGVEKTLGDRTHFNRQRTRLTKVQVGSAWTLQAGTTCEIDSFFPRRSFSDVAGSGDQGGYHSGQSKILTMTWTGGAAAGETFEGSWSRRTGDYSGTYWHDGQSVAATLIPFSAGGCGTVLTPTFHSQMELSTLVPGAYDIDRAIVTGVGRVVPTGTVHFYVCPGGEICTPISSGVVDLGPVSLSGTAGISTAAVSSARFTPSARGSYCFLGVYSGDARYAAASDGSISHECFTMATGNPAVATKPASPSIVIGASETDAATVLGSERVSPTGSVHFYECAGGTSPCTVENAANAGSDLGIVSLSDVLGTPAASSVAFTPQATGSYCFLAVYSGDASYFPASDGSSDECFTVTTATASMNARPDPEDFTVGMSTRDTATVRGAYGLTPTGSVTFSICGPQETSFAVACSDAGTDVGSAPLSGTGDGSADAAATSPSVTPSSAGVYCFFAVYSGDSHYNPVADGSTGDECFQVDPTDTHPTTTIPG
ncbi:MAG TPA: Ig-like domain-containing protein [Acidimicrobiales bacterium]|nr:Ig-like domain-containing protein [Acidimicrobiales bacterium]